MQQNIKAGVLAILPHDNFGYHLDSKGDTIDKDLEIKNFAYAGKVLGDIWSQTIINGFPLSLLMLIPKVNVDVIKKKIGFQNMLDKVNIVSISSSMIAMLADYRFDLR